MLVTYESIRKWCKKFGQQYALPELPSPSATSVINGIKGEMVISIDGQKYYLWRAVDSDGNVLDILMQIRRDTRLGEQVFPQTAQKVGRSTSTCDRQT